MRPILIVGARDVGKTTLIRRLISDTSRPIGGFCTEKRLTDSTGAHSVYLHPAGLPPSGALLHPGQPGGPLGRTDHAGLPRCL